MGYILAHILSRRSFKQLNQIVHLCDGCHRQEVQGCSPISWRNSAISYSFVISRLSFYFWYLGPPTMALSSLGVNFDDLIIYPLMNFREWSWTQHSLWIQGSNWRKYPLFTLWLNLKSLPPFRIRFLRRWARCPLHCHGRWSIFLV